VNALSGALRSAFFQRALVEAVLVGALGGIVGVHVLLRRLPFFVVALSHATLPGIVAASALGLSVLAGGLAGGSVVLAFVVLLGRRRLVDEASGIAIVLAAAFAAGVLAQSARPGSSRELSAFLVGSVLSVTRGDIAATVLVGTVTLAVLAAFHKELVLAAFDREGAEALGYPVVALDVVVLGAVVAAVAVATVAVGTLLAVALLTVPALVARLWVDRVGPAMALGAAVGAASALAGLVVSTQWRIAAGAAIALAASALFVASVGLRGVLRLRPAQRRAGVVVG
jgi:manganese/iron transport system permease protein